MTVTLIGYRGCGKSSVAPLVAERLGYECVDSDQQIVARAGKSIAEIFEQDGEAEFRRQEADILKSLLETSGLVVAAGGGAILKEVNRQCMKAAGPVIWLKAPADVLAERIRRDASSDSQRPSLTGRTVFEEVAEVLAERMPLYQDAATFSVDATQRTDQITDAIIRKIAQLSHGDSP